MVRRKDAGMAVQDYPCEAVRMFHMYSNKIGSHEPCMCWSGHREQWNSWVHVLCSLGGLYQAQLKICCRDPAPETPLTAWTVNNSLAQEV